MTTATPTRRRPQFMEPDLKVTLIFSIIGFLVNFGVGVVAPILPLYALTFNVSVVIVGALVASSGVAKVMLDMPSGLVADRVGVKRFMLIGIGIVFTAAVLSAFAVDVWMLLIGLVLIGAGSAIYFTASYLGIGRTAPPRKRGAHLSIFISLQFLGSTSGPVLGGIVGQRFGLSAPFLIYAAFAAGSLLVVHRFIREASLRSERAERMTLDRVLSTLGNYSLASINLGLLAISLLRTGLVATIVPLYATMNLGMSPSALGLVLTVSSAFNFLILFPAGSLSDRYGRRPFLFASLALSGLVAALIPLYPDPAWFAVSMSAMGLTLGLSGSIGAFVTDVSPSADLGIAMGLFRTIGDVGSIMGPLILTMLLPSTIGPVGAGPFLLAGLIIFLSSVPIIWARDPVLRRRPGRH
jgi:DHA1 family multidrug resistance protein-like MFS transporter